jgi:uncharacterized protein YbjT (DUF2867 family)
VSKIMVFGAGGQVGRHLIETGAQLGRNVVSLTHAEADICDPSAVESTARPVSFLPAGAAKPGLEPAETPEEPQAKGRL